MKALGSWQRKAILMHCVEQFKARKDELAMSLCIEAGKPIKVAALPTVCGGLGLLNILNPIPQPRMLPAY